MTILRLFLTVGGLNLTLLPVPVIVPADAVQVYVKVSPSGSDAPTVRVLVAAEVMLAGLAANLLVIIGA